tara:strand:- start:38 stop:262 length:225 start_codon:yes stop_codon:yes gene_type:complete
MTCGKILADKWLRYLQIVKNKKDKDDNNNDDNILDISVTNVKKTPEGEALDELNLTRYCCRRHMLTHVDLIDII